MRIYVVNIAELYVIILIMRILVTGCAGFIGSHVCDELLKNPEIKILGIDNMNDYYSPEVKERNLEILKS